MTTVARRAAGFTLLEVLVALAIAIPALAVMYRQGLVSLGVAQTAAGYQEAISRARSHLDALGDTAMVPGEQAGDDGGGFQWRIRIQPVGATEPPRTVPRGSLYGGGTGLFAVGVQMSWQGSRGTQTLTLETRRLGPVPALAP
ncbi:MAG: hypothetical protein NVSMB18_11140 [Acetobacteraceae bacterium]